MDKLIERINEIEDAINQHQHSIFLLENEKNMLIDELDYMQEQERETEDIAWRMMKL